MPNPLRQSLLALAAVGLLASPGVAAAQESRSAAGARELVQLLEQQKLQYVAAKVPDTADEYVAALHIPGLQLIVVSARYSVPVLADARLEKREFQELYADLNAAAVPNTRVFIEDLGGDGLKVKPEGDQPFDMYDPGKRIMFNGNWEAQKLSEQQYMDAFNKADERYATLLQVLIAELKKGS